MFKTFAILSMALTLTACQTRTSFDAVPDTELRRFACDMLGEVEVKFLREEWDALSPETRRQAKKNRAYQEVLGCIGRT